MSRSICMLIFVVVCLAATSAAPQLRQREEKHVKEEALPAKGATIEEVVLESSLHIKPKARQNVRRVRSILDDTLHEIYAAHKRVKRQFGRGRGGSRGGFDGNAQVGTQAGGTQSGVNVGAGPKGGTADANVHLNPLGPLGPNGYNQEQTASNGAANSNHHNGFNSGSSAAQGQAQGFQSQSANGSFGASSASTATQSQNSNPFGNSNSAGASHSQVFKLPNGQTINFASTNNFANSGFGNTANSRGGAVSVSG
ncbi:keratin, type I cytoskeletal 9 [Drosophila grimshawi]|uniref:GH14772 n=1 Tax=Drosophila grimshawi TaxID=7222 RepID=B4J3P8_DROGR|nr:keratin, type I cytoskeletal 9 [Drosophila grimshawi]EDV97279.1 GH14772 [Drosophila grimshawi]